MIVTLVAAAGLDNGIGLNGTMPWHMPADLRHFKSLTLHKPVIMGRKTFAAIGRPLPERRNIVVSRDRGFIAPGGEVAHSLEDALQRVSAEPEAMVIGGGEIYRAALPRARRIHLTRIHATVQADAFFPELPASEWKEVAREDHAADDRNPFDYSFITYERV